MIFIGAALVLLCLGLVEEPCLEELCADVQVHGAIELVTLVLISVQVAMKTRWIGWKTFMLHKRTAIKVLTLIVMVMEAIAVLINRKSHLRITRALRPIFLIDNHFCGGVRRFVEKQVGSATIVLVLMMLPQIVLRNIFLGYFGRC
jgi:two pore calcium channel protein 1